MRNINSNTLKNFQIVMHYFKDGLFLQYFLKNETYLQVVQCYRKIQIVIDYIMHHTVTLNNKQ